MPQHLWHGTPSFRLCEVCEAVQTARRGEWLPDIGPICPGDPDDGDRWRRRGRPPKPDAPAASPKVLELTP